MQKIELPITFKPAEQNLVTCLAPTLQRLAGWQAIRSKAFTPIIIIIIIIIIVIIINVFIAH